MPPGVPALSWNSFLYVVGLVVEGFRIYSFHKSLPRKRLRLQLD